MKVVFWNLDGRSRPKGQPGFLQEVDADLGIFAEVTDRHFEAISESDAFSWGVFSLHLRPPKRDEGRGRRLGCAIFGKDYLGVENSHLIPGLAFPERSLVVELDEFTAVAFHAPPGSNHGSIKPESMVKLTSWLSRHRRPLILGMDANSPKSDRWDPTLNEWWWPDEPVLLGPEPEHHLRDALRIFLHDQNLDVLPDNPLALSYKRGRGDKRTDSRYDFIYISDEFPPRSVGYPYEESIKAGSDHSAVVAELELISVANQNTPQVAS